MDATPGARGAQDLAAGAVVIAFAGGVLLALARIPTAKYQTIGPDLFPRVCAWLLMAGGVALLLRGLRRRGPGIVLPGVRGPLLIVLSVVAFGATAATFGYAVAGFLTLVVSGFATREAKPLQLVVFAAALIAVSVLLFSVVLKVPMPPLVIPGLVR